MMSHGNVPHYTNRIAFFIKILRFLEVAKVSNASYFGIMKIILFFIASNNVKYPFQYSLPKNGFIFNVSFVKLTVFLLEFFKKLDAQAQIMFVGLNFIRNNCTLKPITTTAVVLILCCFRKIFLTKRNTCKDDLPTG